MDLLEFDQTLRSAGIEAALRELFLIVGNLLTTVEELQKLRAPFAPPEKPEEAAPVAEEVK